MQPSVHLSSALIGILAVGGLAFQPVAAQTDQAHEFPRLEQAWLELRTLDDQLRLTRSLGATVSPRGVPLDSLRSGIARQSARVHDLLSRVEQEPLQGDDLRALRLLKEQLTGLDAQQTGGSSGAEGPSDCGDPLPAALAQAPLDSLTGRTFLCYGNAARRILFEGDTLDRLSILGLLGRTEDPDRRRRLFLALEPVWRSVNGDDAGSSPYRVMVRLRNAQWGDSPPSVERARSLGVSPDSVERWLVRVLEAWRALLPDTLIEPWDFFYRNGAASRALSSRIPLDSLVPLVTRFYGSLGAELGSLGVHFDLTPRSGKYPVSFTDFGARNPIEPWIFTSYRIGGLDNLSELLHEVGHAVHIAAIKTRGAYADWPDSDTFTEAIADLAALDLYEPAWQGRFLGDSVPLSTGLRAKYSGIVLDIAWALLEIRAHRFPEQSPNRIWTELTREYLGIRPHPEWSWWALRGQLVNAPGYLLNYAFGAILIADLRSSLVAQRGSFTTGDPGWYGWVAPRLYRFGLERPARQLIEDFLGRPISVQPLLSDLARARR